MLSCAKWSDPRQEIGISPCPVFARTFRLTGSETGLSLAVTCIGIYRVTLNGISVCDALFAPGFTDYRSRLQVPDLRSAPPRRSGRKPTGNPMCQRLGGRFPRSRQHQSISLPTTSSLAAGLSGHGGGTDGRGARHRRMLGSIPECDSFRGILPRRNR